MDDTRRAKTSRLSTRPRGRRRPDSARQPPKTVKRENPSADPHVDAQLDSGLEETFPASDPVSINPGSD
jgi:hypothetical protein